MYNYVCKLNADDLAYSQLHFMVQHYILRCFTISSSTIMQRYTHTHPFYGPFSGTTRVSRCQNRTSGLHSARED